MHFRIDVASFMTMNNIKHVIMKKFVKKEQNDCSVNLKTIEKNHNQIAHKNQVPISTYKVVISNYYFEYYSVKKVLY